MTILRSINWVDIWEKTKIYRKLQLKLSASPKQINVRGKKMKIRLHWPITEVQNICEKL